MPSLPNHWTTRKLITWTTQYFEAKGLDNPRLSAEMLMAHLLDVQRIKLYMDFDRPTTESERTAFRKLVERAASHEPVDYLVGQAPFYSLMFKVDSRVLIPRPSTETIIDHVTQHARASGKTASLKIVDIGTGSGAIAITLAKQLPQAQITATDLSEKAIELARENALQQGVSERIKFHVGNLFEPLHQQSFDYVISNPPYISDAEWEQVLPNVKDYEPTNALRGGVDGLDLIRLIIAKADHFLEPNGQLLIEFSSSQKLQILELAAQNKNLSEAHILLDHESLPRILVANHALSKDTM